MTSPAEAPAPAPEPTVSPPAADAPARLWANPWARRGVWALGALLALWAVLWAAVPPLLKWQGETQASKALGRKVSIGSVDFKPWTLELTVNDVKVATADGQGTQLAVGRAYLDSTLESLLKFAPVVDALRVERPHVNLTHLGDGRFDIDDVLAKFATPSDPNPKPARFALFNVALQGGSIDFKDQPVGKTHQVRQLDAGLPFISSLDSDRKIKSQPHLALTLNGARLDSRAQTLPFVQTRDTDARLVFNQLDLAPYLPYWPAVLPVKLKSAWLSADLKVDFAQKGKPKLAISGPIGVERLRLDDAQTSLPWLGLQALKVTLQDVQPLARRVHLSQIDVLAPQWQLVRGRDGRISVIQPPAQSASAKTATKSIATDAKSAPNPAPAAAPWTLQIDRIRLAQGDIQWRDDTVAPSAAAHLKDVTLNVDQVRWPPSTAAADATQPNAPFTVTAQVASPVTGAAGGQLSVQGQLSGSAAALAAAARAQLKDLSLALAAPYLKASLVPQPQGLLDADATIHWQAAPAPQPAALTIDLTQGAVRQFKLQNGKTTLSSWQALQLKDVKVNVPAQTIALGQVTLDKPDLKVERRADGRLVAQDWVKPAPPGSAQAPPGQPWRVMLEQLNINGGQLQWRDAATPRPVALDVSALDVQLKQLQLSPWPPAANAKASPLTVSARLASGQGRTEPGRLKWQGTFGAQPLAAHGQLTAQRLPVHALEPYFGAQINIDLQRADLAYTGQVDFDQTPQGPQVKLLGDAALEDLRAHSIRSARAPAAPDAATATPVTAASSGSPASPASPAPSAPPAAPAAKPVAEEIKLTGNNASPVGGGDALASRTNSTTGARLGQELLNWKLLQLKGLAVQVKPGQPVSVAVKDTLLSDFYARVILQENGRFNLQDLLKAPDAVPDPNAAATPKTAATPVDGAKSAINNVASAVASPAPAAPPAPTPAKPASAPATANAASDAPAAQIQFGPIRVQKGQVAFSDRFIKPNYSADLTELKGQLGAFNNTAVNGEVQMADLQLTGRAQGSAVVDIAGKLNPLAKPLALDITGKLRELELPPLSTYSVRYAGHGIEKGKLSMDVNYKVQPNGQLTASNKLVLNQLTFGEKVEGAPASLPVKLAVALLADRNGVIDLDLPISGSLNDPQFRLAPIIFKIIGNLIMKAITAPFSLLAGGGGAVGGPDLSQVPFAPGSARLTAEGKAALDKVVKLLTDRPTLQMSVTGLADHGVEQEGWRRERVRALVEAEKRRTLGAGKADADVVVTDAEYPALLKAVYKNADMKKPRNAVGFAKDIPVAEMEALLAANVRVGDNAMQQLALARGVAVKDHLMAQNMPADRLFLNAPKVDAAKLPPKEGEEKKAYTPHAKLDLTLK